MSHAIRFARALAMSCALLASARLALAAPPTPPTDVRMTEVEGAGYVLTWTPSSSSSVTKYTIVRGSAGAPIAELAPSANAFLVADAASHLNEVYHVVAIAGADRAESGPISLKEPLQITKPKPGKPLDSRAPTISWSAKPPASTYDLKVTDAENSTREYKKDGITGTSAQVPRGLVRPDGLYNILVTGHTDSGPIEARAKKVAGPTSPIAAWFDDHKLTLRRSFDVTNLEAGGESATLTYTKGSSADVDKDTGRQNTKHAETTAVELALTYATPIGGNDALPLVFVAGTELKLSNSDFETGDAIRFRTGVRQTINLNRGGEGGLLGFSYSAMLKYEADQDFDVQQLMAEGYVTPVWSRIALGDPQDLGTLGVGKAMGVPLDTIFLYVRPSFGYELGHALDNPRDAGEDTINRLVFRVKAAARFPALAETVGLTNLGIYAENVSRWLPGHTPEDFHNYLEAGAEMYLSENVSVGLKYKLGEDSPSFTKIESLGLEFGIKF